MSLNNMEEAPAKVDDRGFPTKGVIAGNDHHKPSSTPLPTDLLHHRNDRACRRARYRCRMHRRRSEDRGERCDDADYGIARQDTGELMRRLLWRHWRADPYNEERLGIVSPTFLRRGDEHIEVQKWKKPCEGEQGFFSNGPRGEG